MTEKIIDISTRLPSTNLAQGHIVTVVYGLVKGDLESARRTVRAGHLAGFSQVEWWATAILEGNGYESARMIVSRLDGIEKRDPNLIGIYHEDEQTFAYTKEVMDPETGRGSGRFQMTLFTTRSKDEFRGQIGQNQNSLELEPAA